MRSIESFKLSNVAPGTFPVKPDGCQAVLMGGHYLLNLICTGTPSLKLEMLGPDNSTYTEILPVANATGFAGTPATITAAGIYRYFFLPPGVYEIIIATSTANYVSLTRCPEAE